MRDLIERLEKLNKENSADADVTVKDVDGVLSALITGRGWDPKGVAKLEREAMDLAKDNGKIVLSGIKGWIEDEDPTAPGMAAALDMIKRIEKREKISIKGHDEDEAGLIRSLISDAYTV